MLSDQTRRQFCFSSALAGLLAAGTRGVSAAVSSLEKVELFRAGLDGYARYRIPGIVVTKAGTVLTYAEARLHSASDWDTIDLVMRRSTDGGHTFSAPSRWPRVQGTVVRNPIHKTARPDDITYNNPVAIPDRKGHVHVLFCVEYMRVFYMRSTDDGVTFTAPVEITSVLEGFRPQHAWRAVATGPGHGIETSRGRLLVPIWLALGTGGNGHGESVSATIYSDDHGKTWRRGEIAIANAYPFRSPNENALVELADHRILMNARTPSARNRRAVVTSPDGIGRWSTPRFQEDLPDPICAAGMVRFSTRRSGGRDRLLFSNPNNLTRTDGKEVASKDRRNLTVRLSYDEGATWSAGRVVEPGSAGYSDLAVLADGTILCAYEAKVGEGDTAVPAILLARFGLDWLTDGKDRITKRLKLFG